MYFLEVDKIFDEAIENVKKIFIEDAADDLADYLINSPWEDIETWLKNLSNDKREDALMRLLSVICVACNSGYLSITFEQDTWNLKSSDQEKTSIDPLRSEDVSSVNINGCAEISGSRNDILFLAPIKKRTDGISVKVMLSPRTD